MYEPKIVELVNASRAMLDGKNWHEIDGFCSICARFRKAVEIAENAAEQSVQRTAGTISANCDCVEFMRSGKHDARCATRRR